MAIQKIVDFTMTITIQPLQVQYHRGRQWQKETAGSRFMEDATENAEVQQQRDRSSTVEGGFLFVKATIHRCT